MHSIINNKKRRAHIVEQESQTAVAVAVGVAAAAAATSARSRRARHSMQPRAANGAACDLTVNRNWQ